MTNTDYKEIINNIKSYLAKQQYDIVEGVKVVTTIAEVLSIATGVNQETIIDDIIDEK